MNEGFVPDHALSVNPVAHWVAGKPEFGPMGGLKFWRKDPRPIRTFCCAKCGYLESYAATS